MTVYPLATEHEACRCWQSSWGGSAIAAHDVTLAPAREDEWRVIASVDLLAKMADEDIDDVGGLLLVLIVEMLPDHRAADHLAAMARQQVQERILARRDVNGIAGEYALL